MKEPNHERDITKADKYIFNKTNLYKLLIFLRNTFPVWIHENQIIKKINIPFFNDIELKRLKESGLLDSKEFDKVERGTSYRISTKGIEFVNGLDSYRLSKNVFWLTIIILIFGILQIILTLIQIFR